MFPGSESKKPLYLISAILPKSQSKERIIYRGSEPDQPQKPQTRPWFDHKKRSQSHTPEAMLPGPVPGECQNQMSEQSRLIPVSESRKA